MSLGDPVQFQFIKFIYKPLKKMMKNLDSKQVERVGAPFTNINSIRG